MYAIGPLFSKYKVVHRIIVVMFTKNQYLHWSMQRLVAKSCPVIENVIIKLFKKAL